MRNFLEEYTINNQVDKIIKQIKLPKGAMPEAIRRRK